MLIGDDRMKTNCSDFDRGFCNKDDEKCSYPNCSFREEEKQSEKKDLLELIEELKGRVKKL